MSVHPYICVVCAHLTPRDILHNGPHDNFVHGIPSLIEGSLIFLDNQVWKWLLKLNANLHKQHLTKDDLSKELLTKSMIVIFFTQISRIQSILKSSTRSNWVLLYRQTLSCEDQHSSFQCAFKLKCFYKHRCQDAKSFDDRERFERIFD